MHIRPVRKLMRNRKMMLNGSLALAVAAVFVIWAPAYSAGFGNKAPAHRILLDGYLQGTETDVFQPPDTIPPESIKVDAKDGSITGLATYLGEFNYNYNVLVEAAAGSATGTGELVAMKDKIPTGDRVSVSISGQGEPTDSGVPNLNSIVEIDTITGGTGQFAGARGVVTVRRLIDLATGFTSGSVHGTIVLPDGRHRDH